VADVEKRIFFMGNRSICDMLGYSAEEIAPMFVAARHNVTLPKAFEDVLSRRTLGKTQGAQKS
jgi:hypothetical protein